MNEQPKCENCSFVEHDNVNDMWFCKRHPPVVVEAAALAEFPEVTSDTHCHEWECC
jgi:hypothetical protein